MTDFKVPATTTKPGDLTLVPFRRTEGRLGISAILQVRFRIGSVEDRNDLVDDIEGEIGEALELLTRNGGGLEPARGREAYDVAHDQPHALSASMRRLGASRRSIRPLQSNS